MTPPKLLADEATYQKRKRSTGPLYAMGGAHPQALARNKADAMSGLATGAQGNEREQDVHTPNVVLDIARSTFGGTIACDPCASKTRSNFAELYFYEEADGGGGLAEQWPIGTYFNPPYKNLKDWLEHACEQPEHIGLYPVRTNREWWCAYHSAEIGNVKAIAWLKPLAFAGHKQAFPAPLVLVYTGHRVDSFVRAVAAAKIAHHISGPLDTLTSI